ncbi:MAG: hypothetical protein ABR530_09740 [Pyrinomonadaceae bacterium]
MKVCLFLFSFGLLLLPNIARADVSLVVLESVGVAGEFTGSGHTAVYFSNICADGYDRLRMCEPGEQGAVISAYPKFSDKITQEWIAVPILPFLYGVDDPAKIPIYANGELRDYLRENYRKQHLADAVPAAPGAGIPDGGWRLMLTTAFNRDVYSFNLRTTRDEDERFLREFSKSPWKGKFNAFSRNCADFSRKVMNIYFPGSVYRDVINDFGITTPKALARSLTQYAEARPNRMFHITRYPQVPGPIWRSYDNRNFTEKALTSKKYIVPALVFYPPIFAVFASAYFLTGRYSIHNNYKKYASPEIAQLNLDQRMLKDTRTPRDVRTAAELKDIPRKREAERLRLLGSDEIWNQYKAAFEPKLKWAIDTGLFQDRDEVGSFFKDLEIMSTPAFDASGAPVLRVRYYNHERTLGITRANILSEGSDRELAAKLIMARIYADLNAPSKDRSFLEDFRSDWDMMTRLFTESAVSHETLAYRRQRGKFVTSYPREPASRQLMKATVLITK